MSLDLLICTYNNARLLDKTLAAIAEQQVPPGLQWNVCVVDNNSTDDTAAVVALHSGHGRIPGLRSVCEPEQGLTAARLRGVASGSGQWLAFVDDDCLPAPDWVANAWRFAESHAGCGAFGGRVKLAWEVEPPPLLRRHAMSFAAVDHGSAERRLPSSGLSMYIAGAGLLVRRQALLDSGWLDKQFLSDRKGKQLTSGGDVEIMLRIRRAGYQVWYTPALQLEHLIARRRISVQYLERLFHGFGLTAPYLTGMVHNGSYPRFLALYLLRIAKSALRAIADSVRDPAEGRIRRRYTQGQLTGLWRLLTAMPPADRRQWLGCGNPKS